MENNPEKVLPTAEDASHDATHAARDAQHAIEIAREAQLAEAVAKTAAATEEAMLNVLQKVFSMDANNHSPQEMTILVQRIPILCTSVISMQKSIEKIQDNISWVVKLILGAVILAALALIFKH